MFEENIIGSYDGYVVKKVNHIIIECEVENKDGTLLIDVESTDNNVKSALKASPYLYCTDVIGIVKLKSDFLNSKINMMRKEPFGSEFECEFDSIIDNDGFSESDYEALFGK